MESSRKTNNDSNTHAGNRQDVAKAMKPAAVHNSLAPDASMNPNFTEPPSSCPSGGPFSLQKVRSESGVTPVRPQDTTKGDSAALVRGSPAVETVARFPLAVTPASTPSRCSFSTTSSPVMLPTYDGSGDDSRHDESFERLGMHENIPPLTLPASPPPSAPTSPPPRAMTEAATASSRGGLMRRLSRGAMNTTNKLRGRQSNAVLQNRDTRGASVVRRRSDSRSIVDSSNVSEYELDDDQEEVRERIEKTIKNARDKTTLPSRRSSDEPLPVPMMPGLTGFTKLSKKSRKILKLSIVDSNKISWSGGSNDPKKPDRKAIYVDDIREIRDGQTAALNLGEVNVQEDAVQLLLTIVYSNDSKIRLLHLLAPTVEDRRVWRDALRYMCHSRGDLMTGMVEQNEKTLRQYWRREMDSKHVAGSTADAGMDFDLIKKTCVAYHINKPEQRFRDLFNTVDKHNTGLLTLEQYLDFFRQLTENTGVRKLFNDLTKRSDGVMTLDGFLGFLKQQQREDTTNDWATWEGVLQKVGDGPPVEKDGEEDGNGSSEPTVSFDAFRNFLSSDSNSVLIHQTKKPLLGSIADYFVSSSHNTYLMGRQIRGESSVEGYIIALKQGCRCIEIDCWDGKVEPVVTHGNTLTTRVTFSDCIKTVDKFAFYSSEYPLIISLEVHCSPPQQEMMAETMKTIFADKLVLEPLQTHKTSLPPPEDLKHKILIKVKRPMQDDGRLKLETKRLPQEVPLSQPKSSLHNRARSTSEPIRFNNSSPTDGLLPTPTPVHAATFPIEPPIYHHALTSEDSESEAEEATPAAKNQKTSKIILVLGEMGVYTKGITFSAWESPDSHLFNHIYSFKESTLEKRSKTPHTKAMLQHHNSQHLMRIYPDGKRILSNNFNPIQFWRRGVQMVATNWQTRDLGMEINDAMFDSEADRRGYVLKPVELTHYNPRMPSDLPIKLPRKLVKFQVLIISGQHLGQDAGHTPENPYVEFEMYSAEDNKSRNIASGTGGIDDSNKNGFSGFGQPLRKQTKIVVGNGYDPVWNQPIEMTLQTKYPGLVFVRWTVRSSSDGNSHNGKVPVGAFTAKLSSLAQGYRYIHLRNKNGERLHSRLFCHITKDDHREVQDSAVPRPLATPSKVTNDGAPRKRDMVAGLFRSFSGPKKADSFSGAPPRPSLSK